MTAIGSLHILNSFYYKRLTIAALFREKYLPDVRRKRALMFYAPGVSVVTHDKRRELPLI
jgi:hypothetical protein